MTTLAVVDASFIVEWLFAEAHSATYGEALERIIGGGAVVPGIWTLEIANVFTQARRRGVSNAKVERAIAGVWGLSFEVDKRTSELALSRIMALAIRHGLTAYDAAYLELATRRGDVLITLDKALGKAAKDEGILVLP